MLTLDQVVKVAPPSMKSAVSQELVDTVNAATTDPLVAEQIRNNFIGYVGVMKDGRYSTEEYLNAVKYVSYKLMGDTNQDAYFKTFPARHAKLIADGRTSKDISAYVAAYAKGKLVNAIIEQSMVPVHVLNVDLHQKAINKLADLMMNANSEKVQSDSAIALVTHLAKPKDLKIELDVGVKDSSGLNEMKDMLQRMAQMQQKALEAGIPVKAIAAQPLIIEGEVVGRGSD